jgi:hypothetical protein
MSQQSGWIACDKCSNLAFGDGPGAGPCAAGGQHDSSGNFEFVLAVSGTVGEQQWGQCNKCEVLVQGSTPGVCAGGGDHSYSPYLGYLLPTGVSTGPNEQGNWFACGKCAGVALIPDAVSAGTCPAGAGHQRMGDPLVLSYGVLRLFQRPVSGATAEALRLRSVLDRIVASGQQMDSVLRGAVGAGADARPLSSAVAAPNSTIDPDVADLMSAVSGLTQEFGKAQSTPRVVQQANNVHNQVERTQAKLGDKAAQVRQQANALSRQIDTTIRAWQNVQDVPSLGTAIDETATAAGLLGGFLTLLGGIISVAFPVLAPLSAIMIKVGVDLITVAGAEKVIASQADN